MDKLIGEWRLINRLLDRINYKLDYNFKGDGEVILTGYLAGIKISDATGCWKVIDDNLIIDFKSVNVVITDATVPALPDDPDMPFLRLVYELTKHIVPYTFKAIGGYKYKLQFYANDNIVELQPLKPIKIKAVRELKRIK